MLTEKIKELAAAKARVNELEQKIAAERVSELAALPASFGFESVAAFVKAVRAAAGSKPVRRRKARKARKAAGRPKKQQKKTRTRAKITDETRAEVKKLVEAKKTGAEIARALKISLPSVQNIKKALGLVKARA
ncbi:MAG TPA: helix-turn-helix domain-containing protein [Opitutaceae bacterium]|nr:helix-turn-helix domain-containing protein [Opitutaceae bacterium]